MPARGFGHNLNPGLAGDSKPKLRRGAPLWLAREHGPVIELSACGLLGASCQKRGEGRVSCNDTSALVDLGI